jgi:hypothetical protein
MIEKHQTTLELGAMEAKRRAVKWLGL